MVFLCGMDRMLALSLLGLPSDAELSEEEVLDALQTKVFEAKAVGLRSTVVSKVFFARVRTLRRLQEAASVFLGDLHQTFPASAPIQPLLKAANQRATEVLAAELELAVLTQGNPTTLPENVLEGLRTYEQLLSAARLQLASALHPGAAAQAYLVLVHVQACYHDWLWQKGAAVLEAVEQAALPAGNTDVKLAEQVSSAVLIALAQAPGFPATAAAETLAKWVVQQLQHGNANGCEQLLTELQRIRKVRVSEAASAP